MSRDLVKEMHEKFKQLNPRQNIMVIEFAKEAGEFLAQTEKPTHLTFSQFRPYAPLFKPDPARYRKDLDYMAMLSTLADRYYSSVVNPFYPVFIHHDTTGEIIGAHDRYLNHVNAAGVNIDALKRRETLQQDASSMSNHAENSMLRSFGDTLLANNTPEFMELVRRWKVESVIITAIQKKTTPEDSKVLSEFKDTAPVATPNTATHVPVEEDDGDFI